MRAEDAEKTAEKMLDWPSLAKLGTTTKLQQYIRPRAPLRPSQSRNAWELIKADAKNVGKDSGRTTASGIRAIIGAVYFDGGLDAVKRVMAHLGLIIKLPELIPIPVPDSGLQVSLRGNEG